MGYQALLFCPEEKLARVVSQVFSELDFTIEPVHEPFAAVKKLMVQHFDAIVVDCDNEQNAALLFKSARNSGSNQSSLAVAVVDLDHPGLVPHRNDQGFVVRRIRDGIRVRPVRERDRVAVQIEMIEF